MNEKVVVATPVHTWSYSGDPSKSSKDAVRYKIGDTDEDDPLIYDEEITWELIQYGQDIDMASYSSAMAISAKFSRECARQMGRLKVEAEQRAKAYKELAKELYRKATGNSVDGIGFFQEGSGTFYAGMMQNVNQSPQNHDIPRGRSVSKKLDDGF